MATIHKRTNASGAVTYQVKVRRTGHPALSRSFPTKALAEQWATEQEVQIARGSMVDPGAARAVSMREMFERYLAEVTPRKKGADQERYVLLALVDSKLAKYTPGTLTPAAVREWRDERLREVAPATVNRGLAVLSHAIEHARKEWGIELPANPVASVSRPRNARGRTRRLVGDEETRLLDACGGGRAGGAAYLRDVVLLAIETAMRRSELLSLRWEDIDLDRATARLHDSKNGEPRTVPLSQRARALLRGMHPAAGVGLVWPEATGNSVRLAFTRATARAALPNLRFHDLRHEAASRFFEKGLNVMEAASVTGHKDLRMLKRYTHLDASKLALKLG
jgi:integrase